MIELPCVVAEHVKDMVEFHIPDELVQYLKECEKKLFLVYSNGQIMCREKKPFSKWRIVCALHTGCIYEKNTEMYIDIKSRIKYDIVESRKTKRSHASFGIPIESK